MMQTWAVQEAKAKFSKILDTCLTDGAQMVTRRGKETAVLVSVKEWRRINTAQTTLKQLLLSDQARGDLNIPPRGNARRRAELEEYSCFLRLAVISA